MQHKSTYDLKIGNALIQQFDVCADVERHGDDWYVSAVYADALQIDGECPQGEAYIEIPSGHPLHVGVLMHFLKECSDDIEDRWRQRFVSTYTPGQSISAGRTYP